MSETATLSTIIDARVKEAITLYCKERGIKLRHLIEQALVEQIENEIDLEAYRNRRNEETVSLEDVLARSKKRKS
ncbi:MAG: hypothetical protein IT171_06910 [Acidobacteria bacterium]|nr:hypothetical protein [Pyrinomonadaceae bacterium]MCC6452605.1 hypothetical protein [Acidobacteriota bacterium]